MTTHTIAHDTYVSARNWLSLVKLGLVPLINEDTESYSIFGDGSLILRILSWDIGENRCFIGDPYCHPLKMPVLPEVGTNLEGKYGIYIVPPYKGWEPFWRRQLLDTSMQVRRAGIADLLYDPDAQFGNEFRWTVWRHQNGHYRCWGPDHFGTSRYEGTWVQVVDHMKCWEAENGAQYR